MNILIGDNESDIAGYMKEVLTGEGHAVDTALDGREALGRIERGHYDLIFIDHNMPEMTGLEIVKYVKQRSPETRIVMMTGYAAMKKSFARLFGADEYLEKPFTLDELESIVGKYRVGKEEKGGQKNLGGG